MSRNAANTSVSFTQLFYTLSAVGCGACTLERPVQMGCGAGPWPAAASQAALAGLRGPRSLRGCPTPHLATFIKFLVPKAIENTPACRVRTPAVTWPALCSDRSRRKREPALHSLSVVAEGTPA